MKTAMSVSREWFFRINKFFSDQYLALNLSGPSLMPDENNIFDPIYAICHDVNRIISGKLDDDLKHPEAN